MAVKMAGMMVVLKAESKVESMVETKAAMMVDWTAGMMAASSVIWKVGS